MFGVFPCIMDNQLGIFPSLRTFLPLCEWHAIRLSDMIYVCSQIGMQIGGPIEWQVSPVQSLDGAPGLLASPLPAAGSRPRARKRVSAEQHQAQAQARLGPSAEHACRRAGHPPSHAEGPQVPEPLRSATSQGIDSDAGRVARGREVGAS